MEGTSAERGFCFALVVSRVITAKLSFSLSRVVSGLGVSWITVILDCVGSFSFK